MIVREVAADVDGDGIADLVVGDEQHGLFVYSGAADMNHDGIIDIVVGRQTATGSIFFSRGGTQPTFTETSWNDGKGSVYGLAIADLDGDGWPDIAAAPSEAPNDIWFSGPARR